MSALSIDLHSILVPEGNPASKRIAVVATNPLICLLVLSIVGVFGCREPASETTTTKAGPSNNSENAIVVALAEEVSKTKVQVQELQTTVDDLKADIAFEAKLRRLTSKQLGDRVPSLATVSASDGGYGISGYQGRIFTVSVENAAPYLDGYRLTLSIGNVTAADFKDYSVFVEWGEQSRTFSVLKNLRAGRWNRAEVVLLPASAAEMRSFRVQVQVDKMLLRR